jgi:hypothetical protein
MTSDLTFDRSASAICSVGSKYPMEPVDSANGNVTPIGNVKNSQGHDHVNGTTTAVPVGGTTETVMLNV